MMRLPLYIQGVAILCWGWQVEMLLYAIPMALLLELKSHVNRRWVFSQKEFYLLADITSVVLVGLVVYYFATARVTHFLFFLVQVMPMVFYPLVLARNYSTTEKLTLDVFFYSIRNDAMSKPGILELDHIYVGICLVAMSTQVDSRSWYLLVAAALVAWVLYVNRPARYNPAIWLSLMAMVLAVSIAGVVTLRESHLLLKKKSADWLAGLIRSQTDPFKTQTALGRVGELKLSDQILFRVAMSDRSSEPLLLHEASYDTPWDNDWMLLKPGFKRVQQPQQDTWRWHKRDPSEQTLTFYLEYDDDKGLLPVPQNAVAVEGFKAVELNKSAYGAVRAIGITPQPDYRVHYLDGVEINSLPESSDWRLTEEQKDIFRRVIDVDAEILLRPEQRVQHVEQFFEDFKYRLYQPEMEFASSPMENFLNVTRAGHCEYFASATAMMLRTVDIPARYVVGYSVQEYSPMIGMYIVRSRHAHAWVIAYFQNRWHVVDTTPSIWLETETQESAYYQPVLDLIANMLFMARHWWNQQTEDAKTLGWLLLAVALFFFLIWRMMGSPQIKLGSAETDAVISMEYPGTESPFYRIKSVLEQQGMWRYKGESLSHWIARINRDELLDLLPIHYKWRFDPTGASVSDKKRLNNAVDNWMRHAHEVNSDEC
ncbi:MAG: transglutaminase-like domain-containing protein [Gammaproteobacteria bacterium]|nr:transglutaminase-like domain-containing protein [Gammaproteobacteria bacterium]